MKSKNREITNGELARIGTLLDAKALANAQIKAYDVELKPLVQIANTTYDKQTVETENGFKIRFETVRRVVPKYKEIAFELTGDHPERIQALTDHEPERFLTISTSYQAHFAKEEKEDAE